MTMESILYDIGFGLPMVLALFVSALIGWLVRKEAGALVAAGIVSAILNFGLIVRGAGSMVTEREAAIAAGASIVSSAVAFIGVYSVAQVMRGGAASQPKLIVTLAAFALIAGGAVASMTGSLFLTGHSMWNDHVGSLTVYALLFGGLAGAASQWENEKSRSEGEKSTATDATDH